MKRYARKTLTLILPGLFLLMMTAPALAQVAWDFGAYAGRPTRPVLKYDIDQDYFGDRVFIHDPPYTAGATISVHLSNRLGLQWDALYKPLRYDTTYRSSSGYADTSTVADWWEFPITMKWYFLNRDIRPFARGGISINLVEGNTNIHVIHLPNGPEVRSSEPFQFGGSGPGFVAGGGFEFKAWKVQIVPEVRLTYWTGCCDVAGPAYYPEAHQFDLLVGFKYRVGSKKP